MKTNKLTGGALCAALTYVFLLLANYVPLKIALLFVTSVVMGVCIIKYKIYTATVTYLAVSVLSLFLMHHKLIAFAYIIVFGIYPIVKLYIEKLRNIVLEYLLKAIVWCIELFLAYVVFSINYSDLLQQALYVYVIVGVISLFAYDMLFGMFINGFFHKYKKFFKM